MQERELLEHCFDETLELERGRKNRYRIWIALGALGLGLYLFVLLFGSNSWTVLSKLREEKLELESQVLQLQDENVDLQKIIFELKGLEPSGSEE